MITTNKNVAVCFLFPIFVIAAGTAMVFGEEKTEQFHFLLNGMRSEREKIISGTLQGTGEHTIRLENEGKSTTTYGLVKYFLVFDHLAGNVRVDRRISNLMEKKPSDFHQIGRYIETPDSIEYCHSLLSDLAGSSIVFVAKPKNGDHEFRNKDLCNPLDIRALGLCDLWRFRMGEMTPPGEKLDRFAKRIPEILEEKDGICRFEYHQRMEDVGALSKAVLWVDKKNGYTILRSLRIWEFDERDRPSWTVSDQRISWEKKSGVWIPTDIVFEKNLQENKHEKFVMSFDWESVNKQVDKDYFHYCDFDLPSTVPVVDVPIRGAQGNSKQQGVFLELCGTKEGRLLMKELEEKKKKSFIADCHCSSPVPLSFSLLSFYDFCRNLKKRLFIDVILATVEISREYCTGKPVFRR